MKSAKRTTQTSKQHNTVSKTISPNMTLAHYSIVCKIGAGGMGEVYRARDTRLNREVAIKLLPAAFALDADRLRRFEQEARATSALNHPNILTIYDIGTHEGAPFIVAELLEGEELRELLSDGALPPRKALDYAQQVALGLAAAHEKAIVHRDLKPENLFVTHDGRLKILDFGLAKLKPQRNEIVSSEIETQKQITDPGTVIGTVGYMSPEQVRGQDADHRSDIFSFGSILYERSTRFSARHNGRDDDGDSKRRSAGIERNKHTDFAAAGKDRTAVFGEETGAKIPNGQRSRLRD